MDFYDVTSISSTLQEVAVRVIGNEKCKTYPDYSDKLQDTMICAGYKVKLSIFPIFISRSVKTRVIHGPSEMDHLAKPLIPP